MSGEAIADIIRESDADREQRLKNEAEEAKQAKIKQEAEDKKNSIIQSTLSKLDALEHTDAKDKQIVASKIINDIKTHSELANEIAQGICANPNFSGRSLLALNAAANGDATFVSIFPQLTVAAFANTLTTALHPAPVPIITTSVSA